MSKLDKMWHKDSLSSHAILKIFFKDCFKVKVWNENSVYQKCLLTLTTFGLWTSILKAPKALYSVTPWTVEAPGLLAHGTFLAVTRNQFLKASNR